MEPVQKAAIERFVRDTLGCQCPDEVFRRVEVGPLDLPGGGTGRKLVIGERLLIHLVAAPQRPQPLQVEALATAGRDERDRRGCNRFRLVIAMPAAAGVATDLEQCFSRALGGDDRAHLHVLAADQLPIV